MRPADAAKEILALLEDFAQKGGPPISEELRSFLNELTNIQPSVKTSKTPRRRTSSPAAPRVGTRAKRPAGAEMSKTIDELAKKLSDAFNSDDRFEAVLSDPRTQQLSKANVVSLYNRIFEEPGPLSKSMTKPEVFNAIRRERIRRVRSGY